MKTPVKYTKMINEGYITHQMLGEIIYSYNKRAKNYRDKQAQYRSNRLNNHYFYDKYNNENKNREKKEELYEKKDFLLSLVQIDKIHKEVLSITSRERIYEYEEEFIYIDKKKALKLGHYFDKEKKEYVEFIDIEVKRELINYYKFYVIGDFTFHTPVKFENIKSFSLPIEKIDNLNTFGKNVNTLLSLQFCNKILNLLEDNKLTIITTLDITA